MPPPIKHNDCVIVFDLNVSEEFFVKAKACLMDIYGCKWCSDSKDLVCLLPFGVKHQIYEFYKYKPLNVQNTIQSIHSNNGDLFSVLYKAVELLEYRYSDAKIKKGLYTSQLVCISDFKNTKIVDVDFKRIANKLNAIGGFLYVFGPEIVLPSNEIIMNWHDLRKYTIDEPIFLEQNENLKVLMEFLKAVEYSCVSNLKIALTLFGLLKKWSGPQPCMIPLTFADGRITFTNRDQRLFKRNKFLKFDKEYSYYKTDFTYVLAEDPDVEIEFENIVHALYTCGKFVVMPDEVRDSFKNKGERSFDILGFVEKTNVPVHLLIGDGTHQILPSNIHGDWTIALIRCLKEKNMVGIGARRQIRNTRPKFLLLTPSEDGKSLFAIQLPYGNRIKKIFNETPLKQNNKIECEDEIAQYLDQMELTSSELPLNVNMMYNPSFKKWWRLAIEKHCGYTFPVDHDSEIFGKVPALDVIESVTTNWPDKEN